MAEIRAKGVIIKQHDYGEGHRIVSIFAEGFGIIKAVIYGAKKGKSGKAASSQFLCFGEFELVGGGDIMTLKSVDVSDSFFPISEDIEKLALCSYFADITYAMLGECNGDDRLLRVLLNTLYALAYRDEDIMKIKSVYEIKLMSIEGYAPRTYGCGVCGSAAYAFDLAKGCTVCRNCMGYDSIKLSEGVYKALRYIADGEDRKMLSFTGNDELYKRLGELSERYLLMHIDKKFPSLDYFKSIHNL